MYFFFICLKSLDSMLDLISESTVEFAAKKKKKFEIISNMDILMTFIIHSMDIYLSLMMWNSLHITTFQLLNVHCQKQEFRDFPSSPVVTNLPANAGDTASIPDPGRSHLLWGN